MIDKPAGEAESGSTPRRWHRHAHVCVHSQNRADEHNRTDEQNRKDAKILELELQVAGLKTTNSMLEILEQQFAEVADHASAVAAAHLAGQARQAQAINEYAD